MKTKPKHFGIAAVTLSIASVSAVSTAQLAPLEKKFQKMQITAFAGPLQTDRQFDRLICQRRLNIDPPCRSNIDPGRVAGFQISNCG